MKTIKLILLFLVLFACSEKNAEVYLNIANKIFESFSTDQFLASSEKNNRFLLKHSIGTKPHSSDVDVPITYADYYFFEMIMRKSNLIIY